LASAILSSAAHQANACGACAAGAYGACAAGAYGTCAAGRVGGRRGQGAGAAVLDALLAHALAAGAQRIWCNARTPARSLYERVQRHTQP